MNVLYAENSTDANVTLTNADTEYSYTIPDEAKKIEFQARGTVVVRHSMVTGRVADPNGAGPFLSMKAGGSYAQDFLWLNKQTLYFASSTPGTVIEVRVWS
jgi:hypothetical protein